MVPYKYVIPSGTKCSRVKFSRRNGENVAVFQATKGGVARVSNPAEAFLSSIIIWCNDIIIGEMSLSRGSFDFAQDDIISQWHPVEIISEKLRNHFFAIN